MVLVIICVIELILITMVLIALENNAQYAKLPPSLSFILSGIVNSICQINFEKLTGITIKTFDLDLKLLFYLL